MVRRSYKFRLYPNRTQEAVFDLWLWRCREFYNACIEHRQGAWKKAGKSIRKLDQQNALPGIKEDRPEFAEVYAQCLQDVCLRVDKAFRAFFRRVRAGQTPGYPRFRGRNRYDSFTYPQFLRGFKATEKRVLLPKIGHVRWKPWKSLDELGTVKTATVKREGDRWFVILSCVDPILPPAPPADAAVGIDLGLNNLVALSDGRVLGDLTPLKAAEKKLRRVQQILSRRKRGSGRRARQRDKVVRHHQHLAAMRRAQLHEMSTQIVREFGTICVEDLNIKGLARAGARNAQGTGLRRNIHHASWGAFIDMLTYKAEEAGRRFVKVNPRGTSQECSGCGVEVRKDLSVRTHRCPSCGLVLDRDQNAALNVLQRGLTVLACQPETGLGDEVNARGDLLLGRSSSREASVGL